MPLFLRNQISRVTAKRLPQGGIFYRREILYKYDNFFVLLKQKNASKEDLEKLYMVESAHDGRTVFTFYKTHKMGKTHEVSFTVSLWFSHFHQKGLFYLQGS
jgi:hypothetical protein